MNVTITEDEFRAGLTGPERAAVANMPLPVAQGYIRAKRSAEPHTAPNTAASRLWDLFR